MNLKAKIVSLIVVSGIAVMLAFRPALLQQNDFEKLQGLWRIESSTLQGQPAHDPATHYLIEGNSIRDFVPDLVDTGELRTTFVLDESVNPKRLTQTLDYNGPNGPPDPDPIILRYLYRLEGNKLILCLGTMNTFPASISDEYRVTTLVRDNGPPPETRKPSGTPPLIDELLGTLDWDDNLKWYGGNVSVADALFEISLNPEEGTDVTKALQRAKQVVNEFERYQNLASDHAVTSLLGMKNSDWLEDGEKKVSAEEFKARIKLQSINVEPNGEVTFWYSDGDLFLGHSIQVTIDENDLCTDANIAG